MKYYHMIIAKAEAEARNDTSTRKEYISPKQGSAPQGWKCIGVCGYHEEPTKRRPGSPEEA